MFIDIQIHAFITLNELFMPIIYGQDDERKVCIYYRKY